MMLNLSRLCGRLLQRDPTLCAAYGCITSIESNFFVTGTPACQYQSFRKWSDASDSNQNDVAKTKSINFVDKHYESVKNQNFSPIPLSQSHVNKGISGKSSFEYAKREHLLFDGIPYNKLPVASILARWNDTKISVNCGTDPSKQLAMLSCKRVGIYNAKKKTDLAGELTGKAAARRALERGCTKHVRVKLNGIGPGRKSAIRGLVLGGLEVVSITDTTPITNESLPQRPRKIRRL